MTMRRPSIGFARAVHPCDPALSERTTIGGRISVDPARTVNNRCYAKGGRVRTIPFAQAL